MNSEYAFLVPNFWVPVAQIVPVFGIAYVLELREVAKSWTLDSKWERRTQSVVATLLGISLVWIESLALSVMASNSPKPQYVSIAVITLWVAAFVLVLSPIARVTARANIDIPLSIKKYYHLARLSRAQRRAMRYAKATMRALHTSKRLATKSQRLLAEGEMKEREIDSRLSAIEASVARGATLPDGITNQWLSDARKEWRERRSKLASVRSSSATDIDEVNARLKVYGTKYRILRADIAQKPDRDFTAEEREWAEARIRTAGKAG